MLPNLLRNLLGRNGNEFHDPPEAWERELPADAPVADRGRAGYPYRPRDRSDVPVDALEALARRCDVDDLDQLFVIPGSTRFIHRDRRAATPAQVLGFGQRAVGLWVDAPSERGVWVALRYDEIGAIENIYVLLYGRLTFAVADRQLTIRYNTVAYRELEPALQALRRRLVGEALPWTAAPQECELPYKWELIARSSLVRLYPDSPAVLLFGMCPARTRRSRQVPALIALTPHELVIAREPDDAAGHYGEDVLHFPRRRLERVAAAGSQLFVRSAGSDYEIHLGEQLVEELRVVHGAALPWIEPWEAPQPSTRQAAHG